MLSVLAGVAALVGAATCSVTMVLAVVASVGAAAAGAGAMSGMSGTGSSGVQQPGLLGVLVQAGPAILLASVVVMIVAVALRARIAVLPVLVAGGLLFGGMYLQSSAIVMYGAIVLGLATWLAVIVWTSRQPRPGREG